TSCPDSVTALGLARAIYSPRAGTKSIRSTISCWGRSAAHPRHLPSTRRQAALGFPKKERFLDRIGLTFLGCRRKLMSIFEKCLIPVSLLSPLCRHMSEVTRILSQIASGDPQAGEQLLPLVYEELRKLAAQKMAQEKPGQTLDAT